MFWSQGGDFTGVYSHTYGRYGAFTGTRDAALLVSGGMVFTQVINTETYCYNGVTWSDSGHDMITGARGGYTWNSRCCSCCWW